jgi:hypothetical protein
MSNDYVRLWWHTAVVVKAETVPTYRILDDRLTHIVVGNKLLYNQASKLISLLMKAVMVNSVTIGVHSQYSWIMSYTLS